MKNQNNERFIPSKRTALDGKVWWCVYDTKRNCYSTYICHSKYKTKKRCQEAINYSNPFIEKAEETRKKEK